MLEFLNNTVFNPEETYTIFLSGMWIASFIILYCARKDVIERWGEADYGKILPAPIVVAVIGLVPVFNAMVFILLIIAVLFTAILMLFDYISKKTKKNEDRDKV